MVKLLKGYRSKRLRRTISSKDYNEGRAKHMIVEIVYWAERLHYTRTFKEREYCEYMLTVYLKRHEYYLNKIAH